MDKTKLTNVKRYLLFAVALAGCMVLQAQARIDSSLKFLEPPPRIDLLAIPSAHSYQRLGVFCKLDVQLERRLRLPAVSYTHLIATRPLTHLQPSPRTAMASMTFGYRSGRRIQVPSCATPYSTDGAAKYIRATEEMAGMEVTQESLHPLGSMHTSWKPRTLPTV